LHKEFLIGGFKMTDLEKKQAFDLIMNKINELIVVVSQLNGTHQEEI